MTLANKNSKKYSWICIHRRKYAIYDPEPQAQKTFLS